MGKWQDDLDSDSDDEDVDEDEPESENAEAVADVGDAGIISGRNCTNTNTPKLKFL